MIGTDSPVVVMVPGDLHLTEPGLENVRVVSWVIEQANRLIRPDFVQFIGDNVQDATEGQFRLFDEVRGRLEVPHFALVGDHDVKDDPVASGFRRHVGDAHGSTTLGGFRFIRLNTQESMPVGLSAGQVEWFGRAVDEALASGERVVIFQHNYPYQIWESFEGPGIEEWRRITRTRRVEAILCGHTHYAQIANDGRNVAIATRSIGDPEGGEPGYLLLYFRGDDFALAHRPVDRAGPVVLATHPRDRLLATGPRHVVTGPDRIVARAWPDPGVVAVRARVDGGPWIDLESEGDGHWSAPLPVQDLAKGERPLEVVARDGEGAETTDRISFLVDPTGRYTAVPESRPVVTSTAFC